ncbi:hypothetical protein HPNQ4216_1661 [Helicobacter pylori NQ4216]|nr:hypothetical protein HPNQ4216_1661 [Helicobacter pylori NQ4216]
MALFRIEVQFRDFKKLHKLPLKRSLDKSFINNYILKE